MVASFSSTAYLKSYSNGRLNPQDLASLCTATCLDSLHDTLLSIRGSCTNSTDIIVIDQVTYPATYLVDRFLYTYSLACKRDSATGEFCDTLFISWLNQQALTTAQECSDCVLGVSQIQLNSPFGYSDDLAEDFRSDTASCGATNYSFTSPPPYTQNHTATPTLAIATPTCSSYAVQANDTCDSIAVAHNVSTFSVVSLNGLYLDCSDLAVGRDICLASACMLHEVQWGETCASILEGLGQKVTGTQLLAWNPNINGLCGNIYDMVGTHICVSSPGGALITLAPNAALAASTVQSLVPRPTNSFNESNSDCGKWYTIQDGDYCDKVSVYFSIALKDFYFLNPEVNSQCTNLVLGVAYCVQAVGDIATYPGYSNSQFFTLTSMSYSTSLFTTLEYHGYPSPTPTSQLPQAPGTRPNCTSYQNYQPLPTVADQSEVPEILAGTVYSNYSNTCNYLARKYQVRFTDLLLWNPSLSNSSVDCALQPSYSYCVKMMDSATPDDPANTGNDCLDVTPNKPGTIPSCTCFTILYGDDGNEDQYPCSDIAADYNVTVNDLESWNPWIGSDCDEGIYQGTNVTDFNVVCVGVNGTSTV
ncbi:hypothetical protein BU16DRAFT_618299 [Lophium mytilinum]|uniref:LysM domain-containing protein n=1 Tax=Lophium mytilinum TaxID=390894 RepID=A0A6A6QSX3_9PEZI|nr:hypothetical protein BU16DRAFT_618299 [Lophium mytilinum]